MPSSRVATAFQAMALMLKIKNTFPGEGGPLDPLKDLSSWPIPSNSIPELWAGDPVPSEQTPTQPTTQGYLDAGFAPKTTCGG